MTQSLFKEGWRDPYSWAGYDYAPLPHGPGVYIILTARSEFGRPIGQFRVQYVGMSLNLERRVSGHEVLRELAPMPEHVNVYFKPAPAEQLRGLEKSLIRRFNPRFNVQHTRGLD